MLSASFWRSAAAWASVAAAWRVVARSPPRATPSPARRLARLRPSPLRGGRSGRVGTARTGSPTACEAPGAAARLAVLSASAIWALATAAASSRYARRARSANSHRWARRSRSSAAACNSAPRAARSWSRNGQPHAPHGFEGVRPAVEFVPAGGQLAVGLFAVGPGRGFVGGERRLPVVEPQPHLGQLCFLVAAVGVGVGEQRSRSSAANSRSRTCRASSSSSVRRRCSVCCHCWRATARAATCSARIARWSCRSTALRSSCVYSAASFAVRGPPPASFRAVPERSWSASGERPNCTAGGST